MKSTLWICFLLLLCVPLPAFAQNSAPPCDSDPVYRQFDFWIGAWNVETPDGKKAGENKISRQENGCLLREEWTSAGGSTGQSINYYDPEQKQWNQVWTDSNGNIGYFKGGLENGVMTLKGRWVNQNGSSYLLNGAWSLLDDGRVRQHFQQSTDAGKTWTTWFDGYYKKK